MTNQLARKFTALLLTSFWCLTADAAFHLWRISEVYSNADGSIQFIEFTTDDNGQEFLDGHTLRSTDDFDATSVDFVFPSDSGSPTAGHTLLLATPEFEAVTGSPPTSRFHPGSWSVGKAPWT